MRDPKGSDGKKPSHHGRDTEHPMKNWRLAKAIHDTAWGELICQINYKCKWYGRYLN
jgi:IS605 OrfB family transposase